MFRCDNCGTCFSEPERIVETHNLDTPPYESLSVCPSCRSSNFQRLIDNVIKRTDVLQTAIYAVMNLNEFVKKVDGILSDEALCGFDAGYEKLYELIDYAAVGGVGALGPDYRLPANFDELLVDTVTKDQADELYRLCCENIAEG